MSALAALLLVATGSLDVGPFARLPHAFQLVAVTVLFGAALLVQDSFRKDEISRLSERHASVRVRVSEQFEFLLSNVGPLEAQQIIVAPIMDAGFQWWLEFSVIGNIAAAGLGKEETPTPLISKRQNIEPCKACAGTPNGVRGFIRSLLTHRYHEALRRQTNPDDGDLEFVFAGAMGNYALTLPLRIQYRDSLGRQTHVEYDVHFNADVNATGASLLFRREVVI